jgi:stage III sporulation protein AG
MKKWNIGNLWKKYKYVGLVVLAGILLMLLPGKKSDAQTQEGGGSFSLEDTERRMEELLGRMDGVGRVQVMLTLHSGETLSLAEDSSATLGSGGDVRQDSQVLTVNRGSGKQEVVVTRRLYPTYQGAVVVCQGAGDSRVRLRVLETVSVLTGLSSDKISVVQWKQ